MLEDGRAEMRPKMEDAAVIRTALTSLSFFLF
jgi:hypothetical protein